MESGPKIEEIYPKMFPKECEVCKRKDNLSRCGGCSVYWYCGRDHQASDRSTHKGTCNQIKGARTEMERLESELRADAPTYLEGYARRLWVFMPARDYLMAMAKYGELLIRSWRRQGIEDALDVYLKILQLNEGDNHGVRDVIPALYIRLGRDQEAYDFLKYWGFQFNNNLNKEMPYLGIKGADAVEGAELWTGKYLYLAHAVSVLLIKIRLLIGIQSVQRMKAWKASKGENVAAMSGAEVLDWLRHDLRPFCGDIFERAPEVLGDDALLEQTLSAVVDQISALFEAINRYNKYYLAILLNPEESDFESPVEFCTMQSEEEALLAFKRTYSAWCETDGAVKGLRNMISNGLA
ncbi:hypothetical protein N658DRAFT_419568 [Parathielavia hyrcaniae]|uniref:MYND-type domain-containing protein n=1 Tax=Parathielavia hyrcaniae TaxID=113614 RepID=A0AAN6Q5C9_9PEZI|nr:hypothetical protein N658DRAFT_419568 [Parathielavia hyrcaniae]